jgi:plasmid stabilization system protein ParE
VPTEWVEFHHEAGIEFDAAFEWYMERSPDAAVRFDAEVDRALTQIIAAPRRWAVGPHSTRRFLLRQFPYILIYRERPSSGDIQILAVAHTSRRPGYWTKRL